MIGLVGGVIDGGQDILWLEERVILKDFVDRGSGAEEFQNIGDTNAKAANAGAAAAFSGVNGDSLETFALHRGCWG